MGSTRWIAVDWGTSNVRAWIMGPDDRAMARETSDKGMSRLTRDAFEGALLDLVAPHLPETGTVTVVCCGMVGAMQGWREAPYASAPCPASTAQTYVRAPSSDPRLDVRILAGVKQPSPPDVMRGEETQIAGYLADRPGFEGTICLPGTHTKWVRVANGRIEGFRTCLSGELFALLSQQSVLRFSVQGDGWDGGVFAAAAEAALNRPEGFLSELFAIRAGALLDGTQAAASRSRLSGIVLGLELAGTRDIWSLGPVVIVGEGRLSSLYDGLLTARGVPTEVVDAEAMTLAGLTAAYRTLTETKG